MSWTLQIGSTTQSLAAWGLSLPVLTSQSFATAECVMTHAAEYDGAALMAAGDSGVLRWGDTVVFRGKFGAPRRTGQRNRERIQYVLRDAWWELERRFYVSGAFASLFNGRSIAGMLETLIDYAEAAGCAIQFGSASGTDFTPLRIELRDMRVADVIRQTRRFAPDLQHWFDHSTEPSTIHFARRAAATAVEMSTLNALSDIDVEELPEMQVSAVVLRYVKMVDGLLGPVASTTTDKYPVDATGTEDNAVVATFDLRGAQVESQALSTNNINPASRVFWGRFYPWIAPGNEDLIEGGDFGFTDTSRQMQNVESEWVDDTTGSVNEIIDGAVPAWLSEARQVKVKATLNDFTLDGVNHDQFELEATVNATSLAGGIYTREVTPAESVPTGIAQQFYNATSVLHYRGRIRWPQAEVTLPLPHCGNVLNLTGGNAAARGWTTMRAVIHTVIADFTRGTLELGFGPPAHLGPQDLLELARMRSIGKPPDLRLTAEARGGGMLRAAGGNTMAAKPSAANNIHPFYIYQSNGEMHAGTVNVPGLGAVIPRREGEPIGEDGPALTLTGDGYVYIEVTVACTFASGFMTAAVVADADNVKIIGSETEKTDDFEGGVLVCYRLVAQVVDGLVQRGQQTNTNLTLGVCDASTGEAGGNLAQAVWTTA